MGYILNRAPYCTQRLGTGWQCPRRTRHESGKCPQHRPGNTPRKFQHTRTGSRWVATFSVCCGWGGEWLALLMS